MSRARFVGIQPDAAAIWDLTLFGVWYDAQLGLLRALDIARAAGLDVAELATTAATQLGRVVASSSETASELLRREYPRGPADLTEHLTVLRHLIALRAGHPLGEGGLTEVADKIEALIEDGRGGEGLTSTVG